MAEHHDSIEGASSNLDAVTCSSYLVTEREHTELMHTVFELTGRQHRAFTLP